MALVIPPAVAADPPVEINMLDYWPAPDGGSRLIKHISTDFYGKPFEGMRSIYDRTSRDTFTKQDFILKSADRPTHHDTWYLKRQNQRLIEYRDDLRLGTGTSLFRVVYRKGREIDWGGRYSLSPTSNTTESRILVDVQKSNSFFETAQPSRHGYASTKLEAVLPTFVAGPFTYQNVAVLYHYQSMCLDKACDPRTPIYDGRGKQTGGAQIWELRYWLAPGKGIIQTQYLRTSNVKTDASKGRIDYVSMMCEAPQKVQACPPS